MGKAATYQSTPTAIEAGARHQFTPAGINWVPICWIMGFHVAALLALVPAFFTWQALIVCFILHWLTTSVGISMTYHRMLSHRSFSVRPKLMEYLMTIVGCCAAQGGAIGMVSDHRKHHAHTDEDEDVHSPNHGMLWAHFTWWMRKDESSVHTLVYYNRWAPDLTKDPIHRFLTSYHWVFPIALCGLLYAVGGMPWLVWGGFVRTVLCIHSAWSINSASHTWGYRSYETKDRSQNNWWVAILTYGEGWHNNHHAYQKSARIGEQWWEYDPTYSLIKIMEKFGLAYNVKPQRTKMAQPDMAPAG
jgi:stearoyl-CoA desaturase (delta-9 desaturase)